MATPRSQALDPAFPAHSDDPGEGRARKRVSTILPSPMSTKKTTSGSNSSIASRTDASVSSTHRRKNSVRENKPLSGPKPLDRSPSKRTTSDSTGREPSLNRSFLPQSVTEPSLGKYVLPDNTRYNFAANHMNGRTSNFDFLPSVNFDDFHKSIGSLGNYGPGLYTFQTPDEHRAANRSGNSTHTGGPRTGDTLGRRASTLRQQATKGRQSKALNISPASAAATASMPPVAAPISSSFRARRQSSQIVAPPAAYTAATLATKAPKTPVGTATSMPGGHETNRQISNSENVSAQLRSKGLRDGGSATDGPGITAAARSNKTKSVHVTSKQSQPTLTSFPQGSSPSTGFQSPGKPLRRPATPGSSSSSKRQSGHSDKYSGLGARTISPTDARRLKRLSLHNVPPLPPAPPSPQSGMHPDWLLRSVSRSSSPSLLPKSTATPRSATVTPSDAFVLTPSISKKPSDGSMRAYSRTGQSFPSKLPVRTSSSLGLDKDLLRNVHSSLGNDRPEIVPPVPAIPKAYESPGDACAHQSSFFDCFSPDKHLNLDADRDGPPVEELSHLSYASVKNETPKPKEETRNHRRGLTFGGDGDVDKKANTGRLHKRSMRSIMLPPLNLQPLGGGGKTVFHSRPSQEVDQQEHSPAPSTPRRRIAKTPSTPMTASRAAFDRTRAEDREGPTRSNTSHETIRLGGADSSPIPAHVPPLPTSLNGKASKQRMSPYVSYSLPKGSVDFEARKLLRKSSKADGQLNTYTVSSSEQEPDMPAPPSGIRAKLNNLGWKRSLSRTRQLSVSKESFDKDTSKHTEMPPPKLPASAMWSGVRKSSSPATGIASDVTKSTRRRSSVGNFLHDHAASLRKSDSSGSTSLVDVSTAIPKDAQAKINAPAKRSSGILHVSRHVLPNKSSSSSRTTSALELSLAESRLADESLRRLMTKVPAFVKANNQLEELYSRACASPKLVPSQVLAAAGVSHSYIPSGSLNIFERAEILDYPTVYFTGLASAEKVKPDLGDSAGNFGYDDERGDYKIVDGDHLAYRWEICGVLGRGSFGTVARCIDHADGSLCAVKIVRNKKRFHQQAVVEVGILRKLGEWDPDRRHGLLPLTGHQHFRSHLIIVTPLLSHNLYDLLRHLSFRGLPMNVIRHMTRQLLFSLSLLADKRVIHCDLKPENILLNTSGGRSYGEESKVTVIDFGSSCEVGQEVYTYIQSRFYRSPEVVLGLSYGLEIDMWSLGCILAELHTGYPLFPGTDESELLACIMEIFSPPPSHMISSSPRRKLFFDSSGKPRISVNSKGRRRRPGTKSLKSALSLGSSHEEEAFARFVEVCLKWDPRDRLTPQQALEHEFLTGRRDQPQRMPPTKYVPRTRAVNGTGPIALSMSSAKLSATNSPTKEALAAYQPSSAANTEKRIVSRPLPLLPPTSTASAEAPRFVAPTTASANRAVSNSTSNSVSPVKSNINRRHSTVSDLTHLYGGSGAASTTSQAIVGTGVSGSNSLGQPHSFVSNLPSNAPATSERAMRAYGSNAASKKRVREIGATATGYNVFAGATPSKYFSKGAGMTSGSLGNNFVGNGSGNFATAAARASLGNGKL